MEEDVFERLIEDQPSTSSQSIAEPSKETKDINAADEPGTSQEEAEERKNRRVQYALCLPKQMYLWDSGKTRHMSVYTLAALSYPMNPNPRPIPKAKFEHEKPELDEACSVCRKLVYPPKPRDTRPTMHPEPDYRNIPFQDQKFLLDGDCRLLPAEAFHNGQVIDYVSCEPGCIHCAQMHPIAGKTIKQQTAEQGVHYYARLKTYDHIYYTRPAAYKVFPPKSEFAQNNSWHTQCFCRLRYFPSKYMDKWEQQVFLMYMYRYAQQVYEPFYPHTASWYKQTGKYEIDPDPEILWVFHMQGFHIHGFYRFVCTPKDKKAGVILLENTMSSVQWKVSRNGVSLWSLDERQQFFYESCNTFFLCNARLKSRATMLSGPPPVKRGRTPKDPSRTSSQKDKDQKPVCPFDETDTWFTRYLNENSEAERIEEERREAIRVAALNDAEVPIHACARVPAHAPAPVPDPIVQAANHVEPIAVHQYESGNRALVYDAAQFNAAYQRRMPPQVPTTSAAAAVPQSRLFPVRRMQQQIRPGMTVVRPGDPMHAAYIAQNRGQPRFQAPSQAPTRADTSPRLPPIVSPGQSAAASTGQPAAKRVAYIIKDSSSGATQMQAVPRTMPSRPATMPVTYYRTAPSAASASGVAASQLPQTSTTAAPHRVVRQVVRVNKAPIRVPPQVQPQVQVTQPVQQFEQLMQPMTHSVPSPSPMISGAQMRPTHQPPHRLIIRPQVTAPVHAPHQQSPMPPVQHVPQPAPIQHAPAPHPVPRAPIQRGPVSTSVRQPTRVVTVYRAPAAAPTQYPPLAAPIRHTPVPEAVHQTPIPSPIYQATPSPVNYSPITTPVQHSPVPVKNEPLASSSSSSLLSVMPKNEMEEPPELTPIKTILRKAIKVSAEQMRRPNVSQEVVYSTFQTNEPSITITRRTQTPDGKFKVVRYQATNGALTRTDEIVKRPRLSSPPNTDIEPPQLSAEVKTESKDNVVPMEVMDDVDRMDEDMVPFVPDIELSKNVYNKMPNEDKQLLFLIREVLKEQQLVGCHTEAAMEFQQNPTKYINQLKVLPEDNIQELASYMQKRMDEAKKVDLTVDEQLPVDFLEDQGRAQATDEMSGISNEKAETIRTIEDILEERAKNYKRPLEIKNLVPDYEHLEQMVTEDLSVLLLKLQNLNGVLGEEISAYFYIPGADINIKTRVLMWRVLWHCRLRATKVAMMNDLQEIFSLNVQQAMAAYTWYLQTRLEFTTWTQKDLTEDRKWNKFLIALRNSYILDNYEDPDAPRLTWMESLHQMKNMHPSMYMSQLCKQWPLDQLLPTKKKQLKELDPRTKTKSKKAVVLNEDGTPVAPKRAKKRKGEEITAVEKKPPRKPKTRTRNNPDADPLLAFCLAKMKGKPRGFYAIHPVTEEHKKARKQAYMEARLAELKKLKKISSDVSGEKKPRGRPQKNKRGKGSISFKEKQAATPRDPETALGVATKIKEEWQEKRKQVQQDEALAAALDQIATSEILEVAEVIEMLVETASQPEPEQPIQEEPMQEQPIQEEQIHEEPAPTTPIASSPISVIEIDETPPPTPPPAPQKMPLGLDDLLENIRQQNIEALKEANRTADEIEMKKKAWRTVGTCTWMDETDNQEINPGEKRYKFVDKSDENASKDYPNMDYIEVQDEHGRIMLHCEDHPFEPYAWIIDDNIEAFNAMPRKQQKILLWDLGLHDRLEDYFPDPPIIEARGGSEYEYDHGNNADDEFDENNWSDDGEISTYGEDTEVRGMKLHPHDYEGKCHIAPYSKSNQLAQAVDVAIGFSSSDEEEEEKEPEIEIDWTRLPLYLTIIDTTPSDDEREEIEDLLEEIIDSIEEKEMEEKQGDDISLYGSDHEQVLEGEEEFEEEHDGFDLPLEDMDYLEEEIQLTEEHLKLAITQCLKRTSMAGSERMMRAILDDCVEEVKIEKELTNAVASAVGELVDCIERERVIDVVMDVAEEMKEELLKKFTHQAIQEVIEDKRREDRQREIDVAFTLEKTLDGVEKTIEVRNDIRCKIEQQLFEEAVRSAIEEELEEERKMVVASVARNMVGHTKADAEMGLFNNLHVHDMIEELVSEGYSDVMSRLVVHNLVAYFISKWFDDRLLDTMMTYQKAFLCGQLLRSFMTATIEDTIREDDVKNVVDNLVQRVEIHRDVVETVSNNALEEVFATEVAIAYEMESRAERCRNSVGAMIDDMISKEILFEVEVVNAEITISRELSSTIFDEEVNNTVSEACLAEVVAREVRQEILNIIDNECQMSTFEECRKAYEEEQETQRELERNTAVQAFVEDTVTEVIKINAFMEEEKHRIVEEMLHSFIEIEGTVAIETIFEEEQIKKETLTHVQRRYPYTICSEVYAVCKSSMAKKQAHEQIMGSFNQEIVLEVQTQAAISAIKNKSALQLCQLLEDNVQDLVMSNVEVLHTVNNVVLNLADRTEAYDTIRLQCLSNASRALIDSIAYEIVLEEKLRQKLIAEAEQRLIDDVTKNTVQNEVVEAVIESNVEQVRNSLSNRLNTIKEKCVFAAAMTPEMEVAVITRFIKDQTLEMSCKTVMIDTLLEEVYDAAKEQMAIDLTQACLDGSAKGTVVHEYQKIIDGAESRARQQIIQLLLSETVQTIVTEKFEKQRMEDVSFITSHIVLVADEGHNIATTSKNTVCNDMLTATAMNIIGEEYARRQINNKAKGEILGSLVGVKNLSCSATRTETQTEFSLNNFVGELVQKNVADEHAQKQKELAEIAEKEKRRIEEDLRRHDESDMGQYLMSGEPVMTGLEALDIQAAVDDNILLSSSATIDQGDSWENLAPDEPSASDRVPTSLNELDPSFTGLEGAPFGSDTTIFSTYLCQGVKPVSLSDLGALRAQCEVESVSSGSNSTSESATSESSIMTSGSNITTSGINILSPEQYIYNNLANQPLSSQNNVNMSPTGHNLSINLPPLQIGGEDSSPTNIQETQPSQPTVSYESESSNSRDAYGCPPMDNFSGYSPYSTHLQSNYSGSLESNQQYQYQQPSTSMMAPSAHHFPSLGQDFQTSPSNATSHVPSPTDYNVQHGMMQMQHQQALYGRNTSPAGSNPTTPHNIPTTGLSPQTSSQKNPALSAQLNQPSMSMMHSVRRQQHLQMRPQYPPMYPQGNMQSMHMMPNHQQYYPQGSYITMSTQPQSYQPTPTPQTHYMHVVQKPDDFNHLYARQAAATGMNAAAHMQKYPSMQNPYGMTMHHQQVMQHSGMQQRAMVPQPGQMMYPPQNSPAPIQSHYTHPAMQIQQQQQQQQQQQMPAQRRRKAAARVTPESQVAAAPTARRGRGKKAQPIPMAQQTSSHQPPMPPQHMMGGAMMSGRMPMHNDSYNTELSGNAYSTQNMPGPSMMAPQMVNATPGSGLLLNYSAHNNGNVQNQMNQNFRLGHIRKGRIKRNVSERAKIVARILKAYRSHLDLQKSQSSPVSGTEDVRNVAANRSESSQRTSSQRKLPFNINRPLFRNYAQYRFHQIFVKRFHPEGNSSGRRPGIRSKSKLVQKIELRRRDLKTFRRVERGRIQSTKQITSSQLDIENQAVVKIRKVLQDSILFYADPSPIACEVASIMQQTDAFPEMFDIQLDIHEINRCDIKEAMKALKSEPLTEKTRTSNDRKWPRKHRHGFFKIKKIIKKQRKPKRLFDKVVLSSLSTSEKVARLIQMIARCPALWKTDKSGNLKNFIRKGCKSMKSSNIDINKLSEVELLEAFDRQLSVFPSYQRPIAQFVTNALSDEQRENDDDSNISATKRRKLFVEKEIILPPRPFESFTKEQAIQTLLRSGVLKHQRLIVPCGSTVKKWIPRHRSVIVMLKFLTSDKDILRLHLFCVQELQLESNKIEVIAVSGPVRNAVCEKYSQTVGCGWNSNLVFADLSNQNNRIYMKMLKEYQRTQNMGITRAQIVSKGAKKQDTCGLLLPSSISINIWKDNLAMLPEPSIQFESKRAWDALRVYQQFERNVTTAMNFIEKRMATVLARLHSGDADLLVEAQVSKSTFERCLWEVCYRRAHTHILGPISAILWADDPSKFEKQVTLVHNFLMESVEQFFPDPVETLETTREAIKDRFLGRTSNYATAAAAHSILSNIHIPKELLSLIDEIPSWDCKERIHIRNTVEFGLLNIANDYLNENCWFGSNCESPESEWFSSIVAHCLEMNPWADFVQTPTARAALDCGRATFFDETYAMQKLYEVAGKGIAKEIVECAHIDPELELDHTTKDQMRNLSPMTAEFTVARYSALRNLKLINDACSMLNATVKKINLIYRYTKKHDSGIYPVQQLVFGIDKYEFGPKLNDLLPIAMIAPPLAIVNEMVDSGQCSLFGSEDGFVMGPPSLSSVDQGLGGSICSSQPLSFVQYAPHSAIMAPITSLPPTIYPRPALSVASFDSGLGSVACSEQSSVISSITTSQREFPTVSMSPLEIMRLQSGISLPQIPLAMQPPIFTMQEPRRSQPLQIHPLHPISLLSTRIGMPLRLDVPPNPPTPSTPIGTPYSTVSCDLSHDDSVSPSITPISSDISHPSSVKKTTQTKKVLAADIPQLSPAALSEPLQLLAELAESRSSSMERSPITRSTVSPTDKPGPKIRLPQKRVETEHYYIGLEHLTCKIDYTSALVTIDRQVSHPRLKKSARPPDNTPEFHLQRIIKNESGSTVVVVAIIENDKINWKRTADLALKPPSPSQRKILPSDVSSGSNSGTSTPRKRDIGSPTNIELLRSLYVNKTEEPKPPNVKRGKSEDEEIDVEGDDKMDFEETRPLYLLSRSPLIRKQETGEKRARTTDSCPSTSNFCHSAPIRRWYSEPNISKLFCAPLCPRDPTITFIQDLLNKEDEENDAFYNKSPPSHLIPNIPFVSIVKDEEMYHYHMEKIYGPDYKKFLPKT